MLLVGATRGAKHASCRCRCRAGPVNDKINPAHQQALFVDIERLQKKFKTHRCTPDFDSGFVNAVVRGDNT